MEWFHRFRRYMAHAIAAVLVLVLFVGYMKLREHQGLQRVIQNLSAETRVAEVLVTESRLDEITGRFKTTIKFREYGVNQKPLPPKYFSFHGNQIQFQALVARFEDEHVRAGDPLKGKSIYLFMKAFVLDGGRTEVFPITPVHEVPEGYRVEGASDKMQRQVWERFWEYALDPQKRARVGIKNAQLEAPGSVFVPGRIYRITIEHDGGLRIDAEPIPDILRGETVL